MEFPHYLLRTKPSCCMWAACRVAMRSFLMQSFSSYTTTHTRTHSILSNKWQY